MTGAPAAANRERSEPPEARHPSGAPAASPGVEHERAADAVRLFQGLTFKQAAATFGIVLALGVLLTGAKLGLDLRARRADVVAQATRTLALVEGSALEAAYQLNPDLSEQVVEGLFGDPRVGSVRLVDDFGKTLAERRRDVPNEGFAASLFDDVAVHRIELRYPRPGGGADPVGSLELRLSAAELGGRFARDATLAALLDGVRMAGICLLVVVIFYFMITRPILRVTASLARVDPTRPGAWPMPRLRAHDRDELGVMVRSLDGVLKAFQCGLDERDEARRDLRTLNQELEATVAERTRALRSAVADLAAEDGRGGGRG